MNQRETVEELERLRSYLFVLASAAIGPKLRRRVGPSDLVQQTMIEAYQALDGHVGSSEIEKLAWVRRILANNVANAVRDHRRQKRDVDLEESIHTQLSHSTARLERSLLASGPTASEVAVRGENIVSLSAALATLPELQLDVVLMYHVHGKTLDAIAGEVGLSRYAVTRELRAATRQLRVELESDGIDEQSV